ncbi:MAG TPA: Uma2 family endonuclease [Thermoanaerobaculia bacterium]|nr:Uma2 family endonuclease [Thermoanaerobaculia bacterium]
MAAIPLKHDDVYYPESDGEPMAETELHRVVMTDLINGLRRRYASAPDVYVNGNMFFYDVQGNPRSSFSPDVFLVKGVSKEIRRVYKIWEEGEVPCFIVEVTSDKTRKEDTGSKKARYERLGCEEYFHFDPYGDYLDPRLQGYRLESGRYQPLAASPDGSLFSRTTGLILRVERSRLRLVDAATGEELPWDEELGARLDQEREEAARAKERAAREAEARHAAEARAAREAEARRAAEDEIARLRRELEERNRG